MITNKKLLMGMINLSVLTTIGVPMMAISCGNKKIEQEKTPSNLSYTFDDKTSTASVIGFDKSVDKSKVTEIVIPSTIEKNGRTYIITSIGNGAFDDTLGGLENLSGDLIIPNSVVHIGDKAFYNVDFKNLGKLVLSSKIISIGEYAFAQLDTRPVFSGNLVIPDTCLSIGNSAFRNVKFTGNLTLSQNLKTIGAYAFYRNKTDFDNKFQGDLIIPNSVEEIGRNAFTSAGFNGGLRLSNNEKYTTVTIGCYQNCDFKVIANIPQNITKIEGYGFYNTFRFISGEIKIPKTIIEIGGVGCLAESPKGIISFYSTTKISTDSFKGWEGKMIIL